MLERKYVSVVFDQKSGKQAETPIEYTYLTDLDLEVGDKAVVFANDLYKVVTVTSVRGLTQHQRSKATKWVVCRVNVEEHTERVRKQALAQEIRNRLQEKREAMEDMFIYQELAKSDPEVQKMLEQLADVDENVVLIANKVKPGEPDPRD